MCSLFSLRTLLAVLLAAPLASAATLVWDGNGTTSGISVQSGTWDTSTPNWWDGTTNTTWSNATPDNAIFGGAGTTGGAPSQVNTITLSGTITAGTVTFAAPGGGGNFALSSGTLIATTITNTASNNVTISSVIGGGTSVERDVDGTLSLAGPNTYTGVTRIVDTDATIAVASGGSITNSSKIDVDAGTFLLNQGSGSSVNRVGDSIPIDLGGATGTAKVRLNGAVSINETLGALTLIGGSTAYVIDLGSGTSAGILKFASISSGTAGLALQIWNWSGLRTGGGTDQLIATGGFGSNINLSNITFYSDSGTTSLGTARWVSGTSGELVPVPEPGALAALAALAAACGWRERRTRLRAC